MWQHPTRAEIIIWVFQMRKFGPREGKRFSQGHIGLNCGLNGSYTQVSVTLPLLICLHLREKSRVSQQDFQKSHTHLDESLLSDFVFKKQPPYLIITAYRYEKDKAMSCLSPQGLLHTHLLNVWDQVFWLSVANPPQQAHFSEPFDLFLSSLSWRFYLT